MTSIVLRAARSSKKMLQAWVWVLVHVHACVYGCAYALTYAWKKMLQACGHAYSCMHTYRFGARVFGTGFHVWILHFRV